ncbi:cell wall-binding repeat-containing protein [Catenulispora subtropica]
MPRKTRLALTAIAATAVTVSAVPASFAATASHVQVAPALQAADPAPASTLSFSPTVSHLVGGGDNDYMVGFAGPGCDPLVSPTCQDEAVPATATWSLDVQDTSGTPSANLKTGTGNTVPEPVDHYTFPAPASSNGTWKVTITFTYQDGTGTTVTRSSSTLIDYGTATAAPATPSAMIDRAPTELVPAGEPLTFTLGGSHVATGSSKWQVVIDYGDGSPQEAHDVTPGGSSDGTFVHTYNYPQGRSRWTAWVAASDGVNLSAWQPVFVNMTPADAKLTVTPLTGTASVINPLVVTLDASASKSWLPGGATITGYQFDCGDPTVAAQPIAGHPGKATCAYVAGGPYQVKVKVKDDHGYEDTSRTQLVNVNSGPPYFSPSLGGLTLGQDPATPLTAVADLSGVVLDGRADPAKVTYTLTWGDGTQNTYTKATLPAGGKVRHTFPAAGTYSLKLDVNDGLNQPQSQQTITVYTYLTPPPKGPTIVERVSGGDRYDTGVHVSRQRWADAADTKSPAYQHPDSVVLATGGGFADALAGVPFSVYKNGALLLTEPNQLTGEVRDEIKRILPADAKHTVYVLGGTAALSPNVVSALTGMGYHVQRIAGSDRYSTALEIAHAMGDPAHAVVARGDDFADALSAGPLASDLFGTGSGPGYVPAAIVLSDNKTLNSATKAYLHGRFTANHGLSVIAVGGGAAWALTAVPGFDGTSADRNSGQLSGDDRYQTASRVADVFLQVDPTTLVGVATGTAYPDALTGGAFMASIGGPLLLTDPKAPSAAMTGQLAQRDGRTNAVFVFGGPAAVAPNVFTSIVATVHGVAKQY